MECPQYNEVGNACFNPNDHQPMSARQAIPWWINSGYNKLPFITKSMSNSLAINAVSRINVQKKILDTRN